MSFAVEGAAGADAKTIGTFLAFITAMTLAIGAVGGYWAGKMEQRDFDRQEAIEAGVGRWHIDPQTGEREFRYGRESE